MEHGERVRRAIEAVYDRVGRNGSGRPGGLPVPTGPDLARELGYDAAELVRVPPEVQDAFVGAADLASEVTGPGLVADLGCGAGLDAAILAGRGHPVLALDASLPMLRRSRRAGGSLLRVCGRLPPIPLRDGRASWALLNGVANLVADRGRLLAEVSRILAPEGALRVADLFLLGERPAGVEGLPEAWAWCVAGAASPAQWRQDLERSGFEAVSLEIRDPIPPFGRGVLRARKG